MVLTEKQRTEIRARLQSDFDDVTRDIAQIDSQVRSFGEGQDLSEGATNHLGDDADVVYEQERLLTIRAELNERRNQVEHAISRLEEGRYGICERCGEPINPERLEALPFVTYCISCQEIIEGRGDQRR